MKRILALLLTLSLTLSLAACGGAPVADAPQDTSVPATAPSEGPKVVSNVDDFLAAIASDTEIYLTEGTYYLNTAADYGSSGNAYYSWVEEGVNDYCLTINASHLTIRGAGQGKTNLLTEPRSADVLSLKDCRDLTLEGMSLGHTVEPQVCDGCVISLREGSGVTLKDLDLYGCGTVGVMAYNVQDLSIHECVVHDCSFNGISLNCCRDASIQNSVFRSLGKDNPVEAVFSLSESENVEISNCDITENYTGNILMVNPYLSESAERDCGVTFRGNRVTGNRISQAMFSVFYSEFLMDGNLFDENESRNWYATASTHAVDLEGVEVVFEDASQETLPAAPGVAASVSTGEQAQVHVSTTDEFLKALASDTCIILDTDLIDLSAASEYAEAEKYLSRSDYGATFGGATENYCWEYDFDGPGLVIKNLTNLTIKAEGVDRAAHVISATPRYSDVLTFDGCSAITISGFTAGHTKEPGSCAGGVILFRNCKNLLVDNCGLFGCGVIGVQAQRCENLQVVNSEIYECSQSGITLYDTNTVAISGTLIRDIGSEWDPNAPFYQFSNSSNITLDGVPLDGNYVGR